MARLLKNTYFKTSYTKFCSFSTKTNPYVEILKTLKSWEQDLRNRSKILPQNNEGGKVSNSEYFPAYNENSNSEISENIKQDQKSPLHRKDIKSSNIESSSPECTSVNKDGNEVSSSFQSYSHTSASEQIDDHVNRTTFVNRIKNDSGKFRTNDKKSETNSFIDNLSVNTASDKASNNPNCDMKNDNIVYIFYPENFKDKTVSKNVESDPMKSKKKKFKKSKTETIDSTGKITSSLKPLFNEAPKLEGLDKLSSNLSSKDSSKFRSFFAPSTEKKANGEFTKEASKSGKKSKNLKQKFKPPAVKEDQKLKAKQEGALQSLKSLIEAYINANETNKAHRTFEYLLHDQKKKNMVDVNLYSIMIAGWAREGRLDKVKQLFLLMANDKITPSLESYAGYLEAISRSKCVDVAEIPKVVSEMKSHGFSHKDLLQKCVFVGDQREKIIETLGFVERDLSLPLYVPGEAYSYKLLEKLNDKDYEKGKACFNFHFEASDIPKLTAAQMEIEEKSMIKIKSVNTVPELTDKVIKYREYIKECEKIWKKRLTKAINNLKIPKKQHQGILGLSPNQSIYPYLTVIDTEVLVNLLLQETRMLGETAEFYSPNIKQLYRDLGLKVMRQYFMALNKKNNVTDKVHFIYQKFLEYLLDPKLSSQYLPREYWEFLKSKHVDGPTIDVSNSNWAYSLLIFIGSIMYDVLRSNICFNPNRINRKSDSNFMYPAFHIVYENHDVKLNRQIRAHDMFAKLYRDARLEYLEFDVSLVPMLSPPRPWIKYDSGAMLITKVPFIRFPEQARSQSSFYANVPSQQLNPCFDSLNNLSLCPWIINKPVLDIVIKIFQEGGSEELDIPLDPSNFHLDPKLLEACEENGKSAYRWKLEYEKKKCEMTSLWFDCLYKLSIANHFRDMVFWFPHNLDFRGRVYPTPPHFNHLGSDLSRSILLFAAGKPLGEKGLDWLKIHLINLTGFKKRASHAERLEYANEMLSEILDSANNPFGVYSLYGKETFVRSIAKNKAQGSKWWMKSDKPLQTLACCKEIDNAIRHQNPAEYISHYPVHQDGSCNGLQHYAALGRDEHGAFEVNLHPSPLPQDVYSGVAALVEKERERDANMGIEIAQALEGFVTRKVVKQTVMTFVYGVTPYGARLQVLKQLKDMPDFPEKFHVPAATYLMKKIFLSIKEMFTATKKIQDWFTECAEEITRVTGDAVEWVTPLGLPVIQPYYKETIVRSSKFCLSKGNKDNINHYVSHFEPYQLPNVRKQKNAFAPNFIHSLDSTHMMLTSLFCHRIGVTFVSVHDCYWTHASTIEEMNKVCREQFVALHSEPILENLSEFFLKRYTQAAEKNCDLNMKQKRASSKMQDVLSAVPDKGTFKLNLVLNSEYFFS